MTDMGYKILQTLFSVIPDMTEKQKEGFLNFADGYACAVRDAKQTTPTPAA